jgi:hypothetical protein
VRPGGLLCVSHRPTAYYLIQALRAADREAASYVLSHTDGPFRDSSYFNWQTDEQLRRLYEKLGLRCLALYPIDRFAWLGGLDIGRMSEPVQQEWLSRELDTQSEGDACARYRLVIAAPAA